MLAKRLPVPAYDHLLKCSHAFNVLDARGAVGVTERANCFATMRALAREVTGEWKFMLCAYMLESEPAVKLCKDIEGGATDDGVPPTHSPL